MSLPCNFSLFNSIRLTLVPSLTALLILAPVNVFAQQEKPARSRAQKPKTEAAAKPQPSPEQTKAEETKKTEQAAPEDESKPRDPTSTPTFNGLKFRSLGPAFTSGRVIGFAVEPNNPSRFFVASASGGVWKTVNDETTWTPVFDREGSYSIGAIALDPKNPLTVWVGTGENNSQRSVSYGSGLYRSDDGGKTWKNVGLKNSEHIGRIVIDPKDSNIVYVAAQGPLWGSGGDRGLFKTTDNGKSWKNILNISENTGVTDVVIDPQNPETIYAAAYQRRRHMWTLIDGGPESAIYKSTDAGATWNKLRAGLPTTDMGRIGLAISPVDSLPPPPNPETEDPFNEGPAGPLVMPGTYKVSMMTRVDGVMTPLGQPQEFQVIVEGQDRMTPSDRIAFVEFQQKVARLQRAVQGALEAANALTPRFVAIRRALLETPNAPEKLLDDTAALEKRKNEILRALRGDQALRQRNMNLPPSTNERVGSIVGSQRLSTARPTQTQIDQYTAAAQEFDTTLSQLRQLIETDLARLEKQMEVAGAPWTPGRIPEWKDQ